MIGIHSITALDDATMREVALLAKSRNVVMVERAGRMAFCSAARIPPGWHRVGAVTKAPTAAP